MMKNPLKVLIITCWSMLLIMVCLKPLLSNQLLAGISNQTFVKFAEAIDTSFWYYILAFINNILTSTIYYMAVLKVKKPHIKWLLPYCGYVILKLIFTKYNTIIFICDLIIMLTLPIIVDKKCWKRAIVGVFLNVLFQIFSQILKLDNAKFFDKHALTAMLMSVDYYIMLILYWLYSIKGRKEGK